MHGKNLFYFFGSKDDPVVMHFHFGMSGAFRTMSLPGPEPTETTRLQVCNPAPSQPASLCCIAHTQRTTSSVCPHKLAWKPAAIPCCTAVSRLLGPGAQPPTVYTDQPDSASRHRTTMLHVLQPVTNGRVPASAASYY